MESVMGIKVCLPGEFEFIITLWKKQQQNANYRSTSTLTFDLQRLTENMNAATITASKSTIKVQKAISNAFNFRQMAIKCLFIA